MQTTAQQQWSIYSINTDKNYTPNSVWLYTWSSIINTTNTALALRCHEAHTPKETAVRQLIGPKTVNGITFKFSRRVTWCSQFSTSDPTLANVCMLKITENAMIEFFYCSHFCDHSNQISFSNIAGTADWRKSLGGNCGWSEYVIA